jgi:hypothetical protein
LFQTDLGFFGQDEISLYERRYEPLKRVLPQHAEIGYLSKNSKDPKFYYMEQDAKHFYLAQYTLCPRFVVNSLEPSLILNNLDDGFDSNALPPSLHAQYDFGNGIRLLTRSPK